MFVLAKHVQHLQQQQSSEKILMQPFLRELDFTSGPGWSARATRKSVSSQAPPGLGQSMILLQLVSAAVFNKVGPFKARFQSTADTGMP